MKSNRKDSPYLPPPKRTGIDEAKVSKARNRSPVDSITLMTPEETAALAESVNAAKSYADCIVKPPLEQIGGLLADTVGLWRLKNRVNVLLKAKQFCEARGVSPDKLLPSVFVPLLDEAGNADDPQLAEMFANLLASHLDTNTQPAVHPAFAKVLGQLSPLDAHVLRAMDEWHRRHQEEEGIASLWRTDRKFIAPVMPAHALDMLLSVRQGGAPETQGRAIALSLSNLERLGIAEDDTLLMQRQPNDGGWHVTRFGRRLISACSPPGTYWMDAEESAIEANLDRLQDYRENGSDLDRRLKAWREREGT